MVKTRQIIAALAALLLLGGCSHTPKGWSWQSFSMDAHRTGVTVPKADNAPEALGVVSGGVYTAPNGRVFKRGSTPKVAELLLGVQPDMAHLKTVIGHTERGLFAYRPESPLSNFVADCLAESCEQLTGQKVDIAISNFGGIRCDIPAGDVMVDHIVSMLPFNNVVTWLQLSGADLRETLQRMASKSPQCVSKGVRIELAEGEVKSVIIGGKPLNDKALYGVATIDFLIDGGDGYSLARNARKMILTDVKIGDAVLAKVRAMGAEGKSIDYVTDGRMSFVKTEPAPAKAAASECEPEQESAKHKGRPRLVILHTNDTHSHFDPVPQENGPALLGGIIERAAFVDSVRSRYCDSKVLLLHAGDFNQGTTYYSELGGSLEPELVNALGYDCITLGNHELDDGIESLAQRLSRINCPVVCANCEFPDTLQRHVSPYAILNKGGMRIGIIGLESNVSTMVAAPIAHRIQQYDNAATVNEWAPYLKNGEKCDMVILLSHIGYEEDCALVPQISDVDLVIGGHSHTFVKDFKYVNDASGKSVPVITDGCWGLEMGEIKVW